MVTVDCDVLEADGGTRTASINGSWIALNETFNKLVENGELVQNPLENQIAAVSVGIVDGEYIVDLDYENDSQAEVDLNLVLNDKYEILEIQGTAEMIPFSKVDLDKLFELIAKTDHLKLIGIHAHIGSQIFELEPHKDLGRIMVKAIFRAKELSLIHISEPTRPY